MSINTCKGNVGICRKDSGSSGRPYILAKLSYQIGRLRCGLCSSMTCSVITCPIHGGY